MAERTHRSTEQEAAEAMRAWAQAEYRRGLEGGLRVAEMIRDWLTRKGDAAETLAFVRDWADKAIATARGGQHA